MWCCIQGGRVVCSKYCVIYEVLWWFVFFFKQKTAYEMRISDWSSDVCSSDLARLGFTDKYWLAAIVPARGERVDASLGAPSADNYQALFARKFVSVAPGRQVTTTSRIFAGAKEVNMLSAYQDDLEIGRAHV